jgi:hypothetical protein
VGKIRPLEEDLGIATAILRQAMNYHDSAIYRLPHETLAAVASHLGDDASLIAATRVCHSWRSALLSSPRLWSHLTFDQNELKALVFLERSKSAPVSVDLKGNSGPSEMVMMRVRDRLTSLRATDISFLDEILAKPLPALRSLDVVTFGGLHSVGSSATTNPGRPLFNVPYLTNLYLKLSPRRPGSELIPGMGDDLLDFLRSCPLLEVAFFGYGDPGEDIEFATDEETTEAISLPFLRSFAHESPFEVIHIGLFNRLSLPPTCTVVFAVTDSSVMRAWKSGFPVPHDPSYLSNVKKVKITFHVQEGGSTTVAATFINSENMKISLNRLADDPISNDSFWVVENFLDFLGSIETAPSIESLHFKRCRVSLPKEFISQGPTEPLLRLSSLKTIILSGGSNPAFFLINPPPPEAWCPGVENLVICLELPTDCPGPLEWNVFGRVRDIAVSRLKYATPLKTVVLFLEEVGIQLQTSGSLIGELRRYVESVEVHSLGEWVEGSRE